MDKFLNLEKYLTKQTARSIKLTFKEIERVIGCTLCPSAYKYKEYWYPSKTHTLPNVIISTGYNISCVNIFDEYIILQKP